MAQLLVRSTHHDEGTVEMQIVQAELSELGRDNPDALELMNIMVQLISAKVPLGGTTGIKLTKVGERVLSAFRKHGLIPANA